MDRVHGPYTEQYHPAFRSGIVSALEGVPPYRVRVFFPDQGVVSWWLPISFPKTQNDKFFWQPDLGEQVICLMDEHDENGCILGSIPSQVDSPPAGLTADDFFVQFKDGTILQYNRATHQLAVTLVAGGEVTLSQAAGGQITLNASGNVSIQAASSVSFTQAGADAADGLALVSKLVEAFNSHIHTYDDGSQPAPTSPPSVPWTTSTVASTLVQVSD